MMNIDATKKQCTLYTLITAASENVCNTKIRIKQPLTSMHIFSDYKDIIHGSFVT